MRTLPGLALALAISTATAPAVADSGDVHPIVDVDSGFLLGGAAGGKWLEPETTVKEMKGGEMYRTWDLHRELQNMQGTAPEIEGAGECPETLFVELSPPRDAKDSYAAIGAIAVGGDWNAMPRQAKVLSPGQLVYRDAAAAWLKEQGLENPVVELGQVIRIDLEGDGVDEVLMSANHHAPRQENDNFGVKAGDYSFVLLRRLNGGKVETLSLASVIHAAPRPEDINYWHRIAAILDLNGDGVMEVVVKNGYYEGKGAGAFDIQSGKPILVLNTGCGA